MKTKTISQNQLSSECWLIQFNGEAACKTCDVKDTKDCGGKKIRKTKKNELGYTVPLGVK